MSSLENLQEQAKNLGIKVDGLSIEQLKERISIMERVRAQGLRRLDFDEHGIIKFTENTREILSSQPANNTPLTRDQVLFKLRGYRLLTDKFDTVPKKWIRYIDNDDKILRGGGFPIKNDRDDEFIVLKNTSLKLTFSINRGNVVLFEKLPKADLLNFSSAVRSILHIYKSFEVPNRGRFVVIRDDFNRVEDETSAARLSTKIDEPRKSLGNAFRVRRPKFKNYFIFRLSESQVVSIKEAINGLSEEQKQSKQDIVRDDVIEEVNRYYPPPEEEKKEEKAEKDENDELANELLALINRGLIR